MKILKSVRTRPGWPCVFIAMPTTNDISPETTYALFAAKEKLLESGIDSALTICAYDCHVDDQRNALVREFLESDCDDFIFVDSDIHFDPEDLVRLATIDREVVAGVYPKKCEEPEFTARLKPGPIIPDADGLIEAAFVPTGFLKIKRVVFERLYEVVPKYVTKEYEHRPVKTPLIFERKLRDNVRLGGDNEFCQKWRDIGGKIYVDPQFIFGHIGSMEYTGSFAHYLRTKNGTVDQYIAYIIGKIRENTHTPKDLLSLREAWGSKWTPNVEMLYTVEAVARDGCGKIFELGSGLTTLLLGASGRPVTTLEHDQVWYERMDRLLMVCDMPNVNLVKCDLVNGWYDFEPAGDYSLVVVDGPPRCESDRTAVVNALPSVGEKCVFIVDDIDSGLDVTGALDAKFGITFKRIGRFAAGVKND